MISSQYERKVISVQERISMQRFLCTDCNIQGLVLNYHTIWLFKPPLNIQTTSFNPYKHSRLSDIHYRIDIIRDQVNVLPNQYIPTEENIAHLATKSQTSLTYIEPGSLWQNLPNQLLKPVTEWPATRSLARE